MENNFVENFKSEELEERLEFGSWSAYSETTGCVDSKGNYVDVHGATYTITF